MSEQAQARRRFILIRDDTGNYARVIRVDSTDGHLLIGDLKEDIMDVERHGARHGDANVDPIEQFNYDLKVVKPCAAVRLVDNEQVTINGTEYAGVEGQVAVCVDASAGDAKAAVALLGREYLAATAADGKLHSRVDLHVDTGKVELAGYGVVQGAAGPVIELVPAGATVPPLSVTPDVINTQVDVKHVPTGASLLYHASRHDRGGEDSIDWSQVARLAAAAGVNAAVGVNSTAATTTLYTLPQGWTNIVPLRARVTVGGTFGTGETVTVEIHAKLDDGTDLTLWSKQYTATGTDTVDLLLGLLGQAVDGKRVVELYVAAYSNLASTSVTVTVDFVGVRT